MILPGAAASCSFDIGPSGGAEIDRLLGDLLDAAAAPDRLIVEARTRVDLGVEAEPLRVHRIRERRAGAVQLQLRSAGPAPKSASTAATTARTIHTSHDVSLSSSHELRT
mgnify:CR=1 FL=1